MANHLSFLWSVSPTEARATMVVLSLFRAGAPSRSPSLFNSCHASSSAASIRLRFSGFKCLGISLRGTTSPPPLGVAQDHRPPFMPTISICALYTVAGCEANRSLALQHQREGSGRFAHGVTRRCVLARVSHHLRSRRQ